MDLGNNNYNQSFNDFRVENKNGKGFGKGMITGVLTTFFILFCVILVYKFFFEETEDKSYEGVKLEDILGMNTATDTDTKTKDSYLTDEELKKLEDIQRWIDGYAYYEQDKEKFVDGVYQSLITSLDDDYAVYYDKEAYAELMKSTEGEYSGIGCVVTQNVETGYITVVQPYKGSPAYEAGIAIGDYIMAADGVELTGMDLNEAVSHLLGDEGTSVKVTYIHDGEEITKDIVRRSIEIPTVEHKMLDNSIGYIQITNFDEVTVSQFEDALDDVMKQGATGLIFDVRSNPGGLYTSVCSMLDTLLPEGTLVYTEDNKGNRQTETSDEECIDLPMAVIINGNSASASEIFAGALQDYDAAEIIGTQSYGKGIVQSIIPLGDGTAIKFTISSYFTPKGVCIHGVGITPDREVELTVDENAYDDNGYLKEEYDTQLDAAIQYINEVRE